MNVTHLKASQVVPLFNNNTLEKENACEKIARDVTKESKSRDSPQEKNKRMSKILEKLDLTCIESWTK